MKKAWTDLKSFVTVIMTIAMFILLFIPYNINKEVLMLFSTSYGSVMAHFFNRKKESE